MSGWAMVAKFLHDQRTRIVKGQPFIHIVFVWHLPMVSLMGLTSFSLPWVSFPCQPAPGIGVNAAAGRADIFFLPGD